MAGESGFRIAEAFVEIVAEDAGLRNEIRDKIGRAAAGQRIRPDVDPQTADLGAKTAAASRQVSATAPPIKLPVEADRGSLLILQTELNQVARSIGASWTSGLGLLSVGPLVTAAGELLAAGGVLVGGAVAWAEEISGAFGLLPAMAAAAVVSVTTIKMAFKGLGAALQTANTPAEIKKQQEALDALTPSARRFAEEMIAARPAWERMQDSIQQHLFQELNGEMTRLANITLPVLSQGLSRNATSWGQVISRLMQVGSSGPFVRDLAGFLSDSAAATHNLAPGLEAVMHILRNVIAVGGTFLPELASSFSQSAKEAAHFIQVARNTGQLQEWIQGGIDRVRQLWQALKDIGFILGQVADVTREIFPNWGAGLDSVTGKWREFIVQARESGRLREWLQTGYEALQQIGRILGDIGSIFVSLADSPVSFLDVIEAITSALSWIATNVPFLIPLIGALFVAFKVGQAVVGMIQLVKLLTSAAMVTRLWTAAFWLLNAAWLASPIGLIVLAIGALVAIVAVIIYHWDTVKSWFTAFWDWATGFFSRWGPDILMFLMPFIGIPLWIYQNWDMIRGWLGGIWDWAVGFFGQWGPAILALLVPFIGIPLLIYQHWDQITGWLGGIWDAVWGKATEVWDAITGVISRNKDAILDVLATLGRVALAVMTGGLSEIIMLVVRNWDQIVEFFKAAPGRIGDALKALPGQMADIGKGIITGIGRGLENGWNWLLDKVRNLAKSLFDAAKAALGIGSPSRLFDVGLGRWLPPGVVQGVERALPAARRAIAGLMRGLVVRPSLDTGAIGGPGDRLPPRYGVSPEHRQQVERTITEVGTLVLNIAGNLDPTNPVAWRQALENLRSGIRSVERSYA